MIHGNLADVELQQKWLDTAAPVMKNAAQRAAPPNFQPQQQDIHGSSVKKSPNNDFEMPVSLDFKVPPGKTMAQLNDNVKGMLKSAEGATNLAVKSMTDVLADAQGFAAGVAGAASGAINAVKSGVGGLLANVTVLLTGALGKAAGAINNAMSLSTAQLGDPLKTLGISKKLPTLPQISMPSLPSLPMPSIPRIPRPSDFAVPNIPGAAGVTGGAAAAATGGAASAAYPPFQHDAKTQQVLRSHGLKPEEVYPDTAANLVATYNRSAKNGAEMKGKGFQLIVDGVPKEGKDYTGHTYKNGYMID